MVIVILCGLVWVLCYREKKLSSESYTYRPLSDAEVAIDLITEDTQGGGITRRDAKGEEEHHDEGEESEAKY